MALKMYQSIVADPLCQSTVMVMNRERWPGFPSTGAKCKACLDPRFTNCQCCLSITVSGFPSECATLNGTFIFSSTPFPTFVPEANDSYPAGCTFQQISPPTWQGVGAPFPSWGIVYIGTAGSPEFRIILSNGEVITSAAAWTTSNAIEIDCPCCGPVVVTKTDRTGQSCTGTDWPLSITITPVVCPRTDFSSSSSSS